MTKAISGMFGGPKVDKEAQARQQKMLADQEAKVAQQEQEQKMKEQAASRARRGRAGGDSLLSGLETGVKAVDATKRTTLG